MLYAYASLLFILDYPNIFGFICAFGGAPYFIIRRDRWSGRGVQVSFLFLYVIYPLLASDGVLHP